VILTFDLQSDLCVTLRSIFFLVSKSQTSWATSSKLT